MYIYVYAHMTRHGRVDVYTHLYLYTCEYTYVYLHTCEDTYVYVYIFIHM